ncbi:uncharacterized protein K452DRAFT_321925 [Aplosporella prunicola CBS 121167]|uniref:Flo11 n=1 Tax=Aplosporella prunicola CBS 121167 TaxID=1176127 RepID=A0A6A6AZM2_9PEZI|nr:uncharacterized protein K452DRAFT_321925 [Aplosporella prunicola CBS 121167]KAF2137230.1 hypothetical protein K452DRAFT_321925 [Aplosporella prunicola CBS 121167]
MHRTPRQDSNPSPRSSQAHSVTSDRHSSTTSNLAHVFVPTRIAPSPAYVAVAAASQIVSDHHNAQIIDELGPEEAEYAPAEVALFSDEALSLLNSFLDSLLYSILATARSPSLLAIRPAVLDVLKPRLAREAMKVADEELSGLLGGGEDEEEFPNGQSGEEWNLEASFKRTRLRIMVYTRLGELEDEDEERFLEQDESFAMEDEDINPDAGLVSWAAAIFLTSIIEYIAEQTLIVSGQAAYVRVLGKQKRNGQTHNGSLGQEDVERVIVQEFDVEKVALNSALGRLWRTWKKSLRAPTTPLSAPPGRLSFGRQSHPMPASSHRRYSMGDTPEDAPVPDAAVPAMPEAKHAEPAIASNIPLPMSDNDVSEIEAPQLEVIEAPAKTPRTPTQAAGKRPTSWMPGAIGAPPARPSRTRSNSLPTFNEEMTTKRMSRVPEWPSTPPPLKSKKEPKHVREQSINDHSLSPALMESLLPGALPGAFPAPPPVRAKSVLRENSPYRYSLMMRGTEAELEALRNSPPLREVQEGTSGTNGQVNAGPAQAERPATAAASTGNGLAQISEKYSSSPRSAPANEQVEAGKWQQSTRPPSAPAPAARRNKSEKSRNQPTVVTAESKRKSFTPSPTTPKRDIEPAAVASRTHSHSTNNSSSSLQKAPADPSTAAASTLAQKSTESMRARAEAYATERAALQRVSSVSSAGTSILHASHGSESSLGYRRNGGLSPDMTEEDRMKAFDSQLAGGDTVYYTLTPHRMREGTPEPGQVMDEAKVMESPSSGSGAKAMGYPRVLAGEATARSSSSRASSKRGMSSNADRSFFDPEDTWEKERKAPRPTPINDSNNIYSRSKLLPKEPRVQTDPTFDLRDFLLSTTPVGKPISRPPITAPPKSAPSEATTGRTRAGSLLSRSHKTSRNNSVSGVSSQNAFGKGSSGLQSPKKHLEPRSPAGPSHIDNDLIDLIRQGPPGAPGKRIPKTVAPFRDTMDSDQLELYASTVPSEFSQNTNNSRSGLLPPQRTSQPAFSGEPQSISGSMSSSGPPDVTVKRPKKRLDPYAIPSDDELEAELEAMEEEDDDDDLTALPPNNHMGIGAPPASPPASPPNKVTGAAAAPNSIGGAAKPARGMQSMADFLASEPPSGVTTNAPVLPFHLSEETIKKIKAGGSATSPESIGKAPPSAHSARTAPTIKTTGSVMTNNTSGATMKSPASTFSPMPPVARRGTGASGASSLGGPFGGPVGGSASSSARARMAGRDARMGDGEDRGGLSEMADFLKNSGPPPSMAQDEKPLPFIKLGKDGMPIDPAAPSSGKRSFTRFWRK